MKKKIAVLLTAALVLSLAACGGGNTTSNTAAPEAEEEAAEETAEEAAAETTDGETTKLTIALLPKTLSNPYFVAMKSYAEAAAAELSADGVEIEIVSSAPPSEDGINEQITMFESYLESGVDGVLIVPCGTSEVVETIKQANEKNIPVITLDTDADEGCEVAAFIGTNNYDGGKLAGEWCAANIDGQVAVITGTLGNQCHTDRTNGFTDGINNASNIEMVGDVQACNGDQGTAMGIAENLLTAYPDLQCIYVTSDTGALGAAEAVAATGRDVKVIGFDGSPAGAQSILDGGITVSIAQTPGIMAEKGVSALYELIINGVQPEDTYTACSVVDIDNASDYLDWH